MGYQNNKVMHHAAAKEAAPALTSAAAFTSADAGICSSFLPPARPPSIDAQVLHIISKRSTIIDNIEVIQFSLWHENANGAFRKASTFPSENLRILGECGVLFSFLW